MATEVVALPLVFLMYREIPVTAPPVPGWRITKESGLQHQREGGLIDRDAELDVFFVDSVAPCVADAGTPDRDIDDRPARFEYCG